MVTQRVLDPGQPISGEWDKKGSDHGGMLQTRPRPLGRRLHELRPNGVARDIAQHGEQVGILLNGKTFEAAWPDRAMTSVMPMLAAHVARHPPLHERTECTLRGGLHDKMNMVRYETEAPDADRILGDGHLQQSQKRSVVAILMKDDGSTVPTIQDMIGRASDLAARNARHGHVRY